MELIKAGSAAKFKKCLKLAKRDLGLTKEQKQKEKNQEIFLQNKKKEKKKR